MIAIRPPHWRVRTKPKHVIANPINDLFGGVDLGTFIAIAGTNETICQQPAARKDSTKSNDSALETGKPNPVIGAPQIGAILTSMALR